MAARTRTAPMSAEIGSQYGERSERGVLPLNKKQLMVARKGKSSFFNRVTLGI